MHFGLHSKTLVARPSFASLAPPLLQSAPHCKIKCVMCMHMTKANELYLWAPGEGGDSSDPNVDV